MIQTLVVKVPTPAFLALCTNLILTLRYFKQKAEKENKRKKKTNDSDDETSEMALNFGTVLFLLLDSSIMQLSIQGVCVLTLVHLLFRQTTFKKSVPAWSSTSQGKKC